MITLRCIVLICVLFLQSTFSYKILGLFPHPGSSHFAVFQPLLDHLAMRGHHMTVVSHFPQYSPSNNYVDISLRGTLPIWKSVFTFDAFTYSTLTERFSRHWGNAYILTSMGYKACVAMMENKQVQEFERGQFDLILVEDFNSDCSMGIVYKLKAPFIGLTSNVLMPWTYDNMGLINNPSFVPLHFLGYGTKMNFFQRLENFLLLKFYLWYFHFYSQNIEHEYLKKSLGDDNLPSLEAINQNMSILLTNTYFPFTGAKHYPPSVVEVGGIYHQKVKKLSQNIKIYLDQAENGVILFSMGSMLNATSLPKEKLKAIQASLSKLKQKVLMKWEDDIMPNKSDNVRIEKWIPQYDILHHKNVIGFITHAGMLGMSEAVKAGVPVLSIPMYGDQFHNAAAVLENDAGITVNYKNITEDSIAWALEEVLSPRLQNGAKRLSELWNDRPNSSMDTAVFWIEHVAKYGGKHLHPSSSDLTFYQYLMLDVLLFLTSFVLIIFYVTYKIIKCTFKNVKRKLKRD